MNENRIKGTCFSELLVNLTLVTSDVSLMHMHFQNLFCIDYSVTAFFLLKTHFSNSKLTFFIARNSFFLLEIYLSFNAKLTFFLETHPFYLENYFSLLETHMFN